MTVIVGWRTPNKIYLGADNRISTVDDVAIRDDENKIVVVNNSVAVAFSGYGGTQKIFENMIKDSKDRQYFRTEEVIALFKIIYVTYELMNNHKSSKDAFEWGSRFIIAGKNHKDESCMYTMSILNGKLEDPLLTDKFLFPPSDVSPKECWDCFVKNIEYYDSDFIQRTIKDVAEMSKLVSGSGNVWIYDMETDKSTINHFP